MNVTGPFEEQFKTKGIHSQRRYPNEFLIQFLATHFFNRKDRKKIKILELGSGTGTNLWMMAREGFDVYGIDNAPTGVKLSKKVLKGWGVSADIQVNAMTALPFPDNFFDAVVDVVSLQHLNWNDHAKCLKEAHRVVKKDGLFFTFHLGSKTTSAGKGKKIDKFTIANIPPGYPLAGNGPTCFPTPTAFTKLITDNNFSIVSSETMERTYQTGKQKAQYLIITAQKI